MSLKEKAKSIKGIFKSITWLKPKEALKKASYVMIVSFAVSTVLGLYISGITKIFSMIQ